MKERCVINAMYYCLRGDVGGQILVMNTGGYTLGHYSEYTSDMVWQRVVPASDRKSIEDWLGRHFPELTELQPLAAGGIERDFGQPADHRLDVLAAPGQVGGLREHLAGLNT